MVNGLLLLILGDAQKSERGYNRPVGFIKLLKQKKTDSRVTNQ